MERLRLHMDTLALSNDGSIQKKQGADLRRFMADRGLPSMTKTHRDIFLKTAEDTATWADIKHWMVRHETHLKTAFGDDFSVVDKVHEVTLDINTYPYAARLF